MEAEGMEPPAILMGGYAKAKKAFDTESTYNLMHPLGFAHLPEIARTGLFDAVVFDESQYIKSFFTKTSQFYHENFREVPYRYALTGTPNPESDEDVYSQIMFTQGHFCGFTDYWKFKYSMFRVNPQRTYIMTPKPGTPKIIREEICNNSIIIRRKDVQGMDRIKVREIREFVLDTEMRRRYEKLKNDFVLEGQSGEHRLIWSTTKFLRLWQLCSGIEPAGNIYWHDKNREIVDLAKGELKGEQFVIWHNFLGSMLDRFNGTVAILERSNVSVGCIHGGMSVEEREVVRKRFMKGEFQCLTLQEQAGRTGMNLSCADTAIYYSTPVSLTALQQTEDRILSLQKQGPLLLLHFIVKDSVEELMLKAVLDKGKRSEHFISELLVQQLRGERIRATKRKI